MRLKKLLLTAFFLTCLFAFTTIGALAAEVHLGSLNGDSVRFRSEPNLSSTELGRFDTGTRVLVTDVVQNGTWYEVVHNYRVGYVASQYVTFLPDADISIGDGMTTGNNVNFRSAPSTASQSYGKLPRNQRISLIGVSQGWYKVTINDQIGYIHADFIDVVKVHSADSTDADGDGEGVDDTDVVAVAAISATSATGLRADIVSLASSLLGTPYRYGAMNPSKGFDCSGFTTYLYSQMGYSINRTASGQLSNGTKVERSSLQVGDLVMFRDPALTKNAASHVGLYIGNSQFIHASSRGGGVKINSLNDTYYSKYYIGARSIL